jgi:hypothetical protein
LVAIALPLGCGGVDDRAPGVVRPSVPAGSGADDGSGGTAGRIDDPTTEPGATRPGETPTNESATEDDATGGDAAPAEPAATESALVLSASRLDFGVVGLGQTREQLVEIENRGSAGAVVSAEARARNGNASAFASGLECNRSLPPGSTCELSVSFSPSSLGDWEGALLVASDRGETVSIDLGGVARAAAFLTSDESTFAFEPLAVGRAAVHRWVVTNSGGVETNPIAVRYLQSFPAAVDFDVLHDCGQLAPGSSCFVDITFAPASPGSQGGRVNVSAASGIPGMGPVEINLGVQGTGL